MKDVTHVSDAAAKHIEKALIKEPDPEQTAKEVIDFYLQDKQYTEVHIVRCGKCGVSLCLEVLNPNHADRYSASHHRGMRRIVLGENGPLLSSRKRLDGLMGYRCGNWIPNPDYAPEAEAVAAYNAEQERLKEAGEPYEPDHYVTEPELIMCGNNTIIAEIEKGLLPMAKAPIAHIPNIEPHHEAMIKLQMAKNHHVPDIERSSDGKHLRQETFHTERLK